MRLKITLIRAIGCMVVYYMIPTGDKPKLIKTILFGLIGEIKVNEQTWNGLMPTHAEVLDDHAIASIVTYIRQNFGNVASEVSAIEVEKVSKAGK